MALGTARTHAQCAEPQACHGQEAQWRCRGTPPPQGRPSTCPVFRPEPSVGRLGHPCLSPGNLVCPEPGSVAQDKEVGAGAWRLSGVVREAFLQRGGKNGVRPPPEAPLQLRKGSPVPDEASLPSSQEIGGGIPPLASLSMFPPVSTLLGGLAGGEGQVPSGEELPLVFFCLFFPLEFSALNFILILFPDGRCWLPPCPLQTHLLAGGGAWGRRHPSQSRERVTRVLWVVTATHCSLQ